MLDSELKASAVVAFALIASRCLRSRSAALRHLVLSAAIVSAAAMPAAAWLVPAWDIPLVKSVSVHEVQPQARVSFSEASASSSVVANAAHAQESATSRQTARGGLVPAMLTWAIRVWIVGAGAGVLMLLVGLGRLSRLAARATLLHDARWRAAADAIACEYGLRRPIHLLAGTGPTLLVTWGYRRPIVLVPAVVASWPLERVEVVLRHELAHIQRRDWLVLMAAELLRAVHWFNPLVWIACRHLRLESERACDDVVLQHGVDGQAYATQLLDIARSFGRHRSVWLPAPAMARATSLERRIAAMLNPALNRVPLTKRARIATVVAASLVTVSLAGFGASAQTFGSVSGSVVDATNRPISGATLILTGAPNQAKQELRSDAGGHFEFVGLPAGDYRLEAFTAGFQPYRADVVVDTRPAQRIVALQVGSLMETVTVWGLRDGPRGELAEPVMPDSSGCVATAEGGRIAPPKKLRDVPAAYPPLLYDTKIDGRVVLEGRIGTDGAMREVRVNSPAQHPDFDAAAIAAIRQWRFSQTLLNCVPVEVNMTVYVNFVPRP